MKDTMIENPARTKKPENKARIQHTPPAKPEPARRRALGKGLESLLSAPARFQSAEPEESSSQAPGPPLQGTGQIPGASVFKQQETGRPLEIPIAAIEPNPYQTRMRVDERQLDELARSIAATGVVQPILVRPLPNGSFQLIAGERRWRASIKAGKTTVPAILRQVSDEQAMEMTIVENLQRADLNPIEQARAYERLSRDFNMTQEGIAQRTGKDRATIANFLRLLRLPAAIQSKVEAGELTFGHARALLALDGPDAMLKASAKIVALAMSVRQTESYIQGLMSPSGASDKKVKAVDANVRDAQEALQRQLGLKVRIEDKNGRGRVIIEYSRLEDFDALMTALGTPAA